MVFPDPATQEGRLHAALASEVAAASGSETNTTLFSPHLEFNGSSIDQELDAMHWRVDISMYVEDDNEYELKQLVVGQSR